MSTVSTTINEVKITGRAERRLIDKAAKLWLRISRWTHASDVEFDDGKTAQDKVGVINGITSKFEDGQEDICASSLLTKKIKDDLNDGIINDHIQLVIQPDGTLGWKKDGADTVIPFSSENGFIGMVMAGNSNSGNNIAYNPDYISSLHIEQFNDKVNNGNDETGRVFHWTMTPKRDFKALCVSALPISGCSASVINFGLNQAAYGSPINYYMDVKKNDRPYGYVNRSSSTNGVVLLMIAVKEWKQSDYVLSTR